MSRFVIILEQHDGDINLTADAHDDDKTAVFRTIQEARQSMRGDEDEYTKKWWIVELGGGYRVTPGLQVP